MLATRVATSPRPSSWRAPGGWALAVVVGAFAMAWLARGVPSPFVEDDAYFYLQIAWNLARGLGSSFDGLTTTDGYHLLWVGLLTPCAFVVQALGLGKFAFTVVVCAISLALAAAASHWAFRDPNERLLAMLLFVACGVTMEATALSVLLLALWRQWLGELHWPPAAVFCVAMLVPLARVDLAWLAPALVVAGRLALRGDEQGALPLWATLAGTLAGIAIHLGILYVGFGSLGTVSSAYKLDALAAGPRFFVQWNLTNRGNQLRYLVLGALALAAVVSSEQAPSRRRWLVAFAVATLPVLGYSFTTRMRDWYFMATLVLALLMAARAGARYPLVWRRSATAISGLLTVALAGYLLLNAEDIRRTARFVSLANRVLRPGDVVYGVDGTGFVAWWLDAPVVNGDGLMNSHAYRERLLADRLGTYLDDIGATHVVMNYRMYGEPLLSWHGLRVRRADVSLLVESAPTRNQLVEYQLFRRADARR